MATREKKPRSKKPPSHEEQQITVRLRHDLYTELLQAHATRKAMKEEPWTIKGMVEAKEPGTNST